MGENKMRNVAEMFDLKLYEEFEINEDMHTYRFTEEGLEFKPSSSNSWLEHQCTNVLERLLNGDIYIYPR